MASEQEERLFKRGSRTYYYTSKWFPKRYRDDVFTLYAFVRTADDLVDHEPVDKERFLRFKRAAIKALRGGTSDDPVIKRFSSLAKKRLFAEQDVRSFLDAMEQDLSPKPFRDEKDVDAYIHGSAEVIGLFMARIFSLPNALDRQAMLLGRAMQYINWLRDLDEDYRLGRQYLPVSLLKQHGLASLSPKEAHKKQHSFRKLIKQELARYDSWQQEASSAFPQLPYCMRVPVAAASDAYAWTASKIRRDPLIVFKKKVKPPVWLLTWFLIKQGVLSWTSKSC